MTLTDLMKANLYPLHLFDLSLVGFGHIVFTRVFLLLADASRVVLISISPGNLKKKKGKRDNAIKQAKLSMHALPNKMKRRDSFLS